MLRRVTKNNEKQQAHGLPATVAKIKEHCFVVDFSTDQGDGMENLEGRRPLHRPFTGRMVAWRRVQKCTRTEDVRKEAIGRGHVIELGAGGAIYDRHTLNMREALRQLAI